MSIQTEVLSLFIPVRHLANKASIDERTKYWGLILMAIILPHQMVSLYRDILKHHPLSGLTLSQDLWIGSEVALLQIKSYFLKF